MKKRSKQKAASPHKSHQQDFASLSAQAIIRRARAFPFYECWISDNWQKDDLGLVEILVSRQQPDGDICFGTYLVDKYLLGVKNTFGNAGFSRVRFQNEVVNKIFRKLKPQKCPVELAHQMVYASLEYAAQFGFQPEKDFAVTQYILAPRGELEEPYQLTFGKDGKPFFVAGPYDNASRILRQLEKTAGPGNFHYFMPIDAL
ncbi:MAG: hypothetical protein E6I32_05910 [Chloroflexi bacterium]|nr:MAG: hypothetical protein E6I32_05910 [Chloroflexota bacterium]